MRTAISVLIMLLKKILLFVMLTERTGRAMAKTVKEKYREVLAKLHTCNPCDKAGLKQLLDYYYNKGGAK